MPYSTYKYSRPTSDITDRCYIICSTSLACMIQPSASEFAVQSRMIEDLPLSYQKTNTGDKKVVLVDSTLPE